MNLSKFKKGSLVEIISSGKTGLILQRRYLTKKNSSRGWMLDVFCNCKKKGNVIQFSPEDLKLISS
jgi:hypothetical protein|tara:strand:- start:679 stop:876 length:198 start_codon:yes stop_codon:yes gene_type:complete